MAPQAPGGVRGPEREPFLKTTLGIVTAVTGLIAAIASLIGGLAAAGVFSSPSPPGPTPSPTTELASVDLVYPGDAFGCVLQMTVDLDGRTVQPAGNRFPVHDVKTGSQQYRITGSVFCPSGPNTGTCTASGSGSLDVVDGASYTVAWQNTAPGVCDVSLRS